MKNLYNLAFKRIWNKVGGDKLEKVNLQNIQQLLKDKNVPLTEIDEQLFHNLPRQEVKNFLRNPCPINKKEQTSSEIVTSAKALRGSLHIGQKKVCFKCPFVASCQKAFVEPTQNFKIQKPLQNLIFTMKNVSQLEDTQKLRMRSWFSSIRVCDSLNTVMDGLIQGGQQYKTFVKQRHVYVNSVEGMHQKQEMSAKDRIQVDQVKKMRIPIKQTYAKVKIQRKERKQQQVNEQSKEGQSNSGQRNIKDEKQEKNDTDNVYRKKRSEEFIKMAQKYVNEDGQGDKKDIKKVRNERGEDKNVYKERRQYQTSSGDFRKGQNQRSGNYQRPNYQKPNYQRPSYQRPSYQRENKQRYPNNSEDNFNKHVKSERNYNRDSENNKFQRGGYKRQNYGQNKAYERRDDRFNSEEQNPKIKRYSKDRPTQYDRQSGNKRGEVNKFYVKYQGQQSEESELLQNLNRKNDRGYKNTRDGQREPWKGKTEYKNDRGYDQGRERQRDPSKGRDDYRGQRKERNYGNERNERSQRNERNDQRNDRNERSRGRPEREERAKSGNYEREARDQQVRTFEKLEKIPKILKTQMASKEDIKQRTIQQQTVNEESGERKGRRVKRG